MNSIITDGGNRHPSYQSLFEGIVLGRMETYDASKFNCWAFRKSTDVRDGISLRLGNLCGGFPFVLCGHAFPNSESAYLCGQFSQNTPVHAEIQQTLLEERNGFVSKKFVKRRYKECIREDWVEIRLQWMLYVVWQKCIGNADFRDLLFSLPHDAVIIENSNKLKLCQIALLNRVAPPIDYDLLRKKRVYLFGELLTFDKEGIS